MVKKNKTNSEGTKQAFFQMLTLLFSLFFTVFILLSSSHIMFSQTISATSQEKNILLLFASNQDMTHDKIALETIKNELDKQLDFKLNYFYEFCDLYRFPEEKNQDQLSLLMSIKYANKKIDLVLIPESMVLSFWLKYYEQISPEAPVIIYDTDSIFLAENILPANFFVAKTVSYYMESAQWILNINPLIEEVVIIHGADFDDKALANIIAQLKTGITKPLKFTDWGAYSFSEIKSHAAELGSNSIIIYQPMLNDKDGNSFNPIEMLHELTRIAAVPVITAHDQFIGTGTIGGSMHSIEQSATLAAHIGVNILRGDLININSARGSYNNQFIFDMKALKRFNISLSDLPPRSIIKNREITAWEQYKTQILIIILGFVLSGLMIAFLVVLARRLFKTRKALKLLNEDLENQVQNRTIQLKTTNSLLLQEVEERKTAEEKLVQLNHQLSDLNLTKDKLFSVIAHDLRSPFNSILGYSEILIQNHRNNDFEHLEKFLEIIQSSAKNTLNLLDNLLAWANSQTGQIIFNPTRINLCTLFDKTFDILSPAASMKNISLTRDNCDNIEVMADQNLLTTVIRNLVSNAIKFTNAGGEISVFTKVKQNYIEITVSDNGVGMNHNTCKNLFRMDSSFSTNGTNNEKGTGLGLLLCKEFVEIHQGEIRVESKEGKGSDFIFTLPV